MLHAASTSLGIDICMQIVRESEREQKFSHDNCSIHFPAGESQLCRIYGMTELVRFVCYHENELARESHSMSWLHLWESHVCIFASTIFTFEILWNEVVEIEILLLLFEILFTFVLVLALLLILVVPVSGQGLRTCGTWCSSRTQLRQS